VAAVLETRGAVSECKDLSERAVGCSRRGIGVWKRSLRTLRVHRAVSAAALRGKGRERAGR
jgi:hypothetical protein